MVHAAKTGKTEICRLLIDWGFWDPSDRKLGIDSLTEASANGHEDTVTMLLEALPTYVQDKPWLGIARLRDAARHVLSHTVKQLLEHLNIPLAQSDASGRTTLHHAVDNGHLEVLRNCTDFLGRMDSLVHFVAKIPGQERNVRSLLGIRIQLIRQFEPGPDWALNDQITVTSDYLTGTTDYIRKLFHRMIARVNQQQSQVSGQRPGASQGPNAQQTNQNMAPLNASNLQQPQQQEEALQQAPQSLEPGCCLICRRFHRHHSSTPR
ncbi:mediator complex subunit 15-domain-containing protein [Aspergillus undulatus]|uniref:mediator complex subunit 15-domain-containing protein n=1 Tax=Aspergillus undulatus TaxID=1810928 RepID=UPI003CCD79BA